VQGERLKDADDNRILVGRALAEQLRTDVGYRLVIITQGADGSTREAGFRIAGLFDADGSGLEKAFVFTGMRFLQSMLDAQGVTEVSIRLTDDPQEGSIATRLREFFTGLDVLRWQELEPLAAAMFEFTEVAIYIWYFVMMGALIFGLVNTFITAVMERTRELGMLRAVGMRPGAVVVQVVLESMLIMTLGITVGQGIGILLVLWIGDGLDLSQWAASMEAAGIRSVLVPKLMPGDMVLVAALSLGFGLLASLYPAWRAVTIKPLEALRR
jgi:ABC-type lipoprotein release transport system permease subunit